MSNLMIRTVAVALLALCAVLGSACTPAAEHHDEPMAQSVTLKNQWASAGGEERSGQGGGSADSGMAAVFGTFANTGHHDVRIVSGTSPVAGHVEVHEVVPDAAGGKTMQPKAGGLIVPAGETRELIPGGDHLMLMELKQPLQPGADVPITVVFDDGSTLPVTAQVREFAGANEDYGPGNGAEGKPHQHG